MRIDVFGIIPPMVTPFTPESEELDVSAVREETDYLIDIGVHGLCVGGSTGEGAGLSEAEIELLCRSVVEQAQDRVPVIGGVIADSTAEAIRKARAAKEGGVMALQVTPPHYLWTPDMEALVDYYQLIGEATRLPIIIYNVVPWVQIDAEVMRRIVEVDWVAGIKQSGGDMHKVADMVMQFRDRCPVYTAVDDLLYPSFAIGADGAIAGLLTVLPKATLDLWNAVRAGDHITARSLHDKMLPVWRAIEGPNMPYLAKTAIEMQGRRVGPACSPIRGPNEAKIAEIRMRLTELGVVSA